MGRFSRKLLSAAVALSVVISGIGIVPAYAEGEIISNEYVEVAPDRYVPVSEITLPTGGALDTVLYDVPTEEVERINGALEEDGAVYIPGANDLSPASSYTYSSSYFYNNVLADSNEKAFYNALTAACNAVVQSNADYTDAQHTVHYNNTNTTANIIGAVEYSGFSEDRASFIFTLFRFSNPQFYFLSNGSGSGWSSDGTNTYYYLYPQFINTYGYDFALYNTRNTAQTALDTLTLTWMTEFNAISSDLDRELAVSNKIINYLTYDNPALSNNDLLSFDQSLISGVLRQTTVCAGYTMMTAYFLNAAGIESFYVNSDGHAWNLVKLYGNWYELDNTWADQDSGANPYTWERWRNKSHAYFLSYEYDDNSHAYKSFWNGVALPTTQYDEVQVPEEDMITVIGSSATLGGEIGLNFYFDIPDTISTEGIVAYLSGPKGEKTIAIGNKESNGYYKFSYLLNAIQMDKVVSIELKDANGDTLPLCDKDGVAIAGNIKTDSVYEYLSRIEVTAADRYKNVIRSTRNYGVYSDIFFRGSSVEEPISLPDITAQTVENYAMKYSESAPDWLTINGMTLSLNAQVDARVYFTPNSSLKGHTFLLDGVSVSPVAKDDMYFVEVSNIASNKLTKQHYLSIDGCVITFSAMTYVYNILNKTSPENLVNVVKAVYAYSCDAEECFGT